MVVNDWSRAGRVPRRAALAGRRHLLGRRGALVSLAVTMAVTVAGCGSGAVGNQQFTEVGRMTSVRVGAAVAVMQDGRVLLAGGSNYSTQLASAEIYDPLTRSFHGTGSMSEARQNALAAVLPDGTVLVIGMDSGNSDLFDPKTGTFRPTGKMAQRHNGGTATALPDGRVLVAGGYALDSNIAPAELFDPATGTFQATGSMGSARAFHTATLLADGRVLMAGGRDSEGKMQKSAEIYDPKTGEFSPTGSMSMLHDPQTAVSLADGRALVVGGGSQVGPPAETYDPASGQFSDAGRIDAPSELSQNHYYFYYYHDAPIRLADGRVLFWSDGSNVFQIYDPKTSRVSLLGPFGPFEPGLAGPVVALGDGQVLFAGGDSDSVTGYLFRP